MKSKKFKSIFLNIALLTMFILSLGCAINDNQEESGNAVILTPASVPIQKSISGLTTAQATALQGSVRYEIIVERNGKVIKSVILKNNDETTITLPAGVDLDIGVGLYLAESSTSNKELVNSYLVTDLMKNINITTNGTLTLDFTLDFSSPTIVSCYYNISGGDNSPGMSDITGAVFHHGLNQPIFTLKNLINGNFNLITYDEGAGSFNDPDPLNLINEGKIFKVDDVAGSQDPNNNNLLKGYWYIDNTAKSILFNDGGSTFLPSTLTARSELVLDDNASILPAINRLESIYYTNGTINFYYYYLIHDDGMITFRYRDDTSEWSTSYNVDFSQFSSIYPELPFILDIERDEATNGEEIFFVSKIGTFYIDRTTLDLFADSQFTEAVNRLKRMISITDPYDDRKTLLITGIKNVNNYIFIGTRYGLYRINKNDSSWITFSNKTPDGDFVSFPEDKIKKIKSFTGDPITTLDTDGDNILAVSSSKNLWFYNTSTGKEKSLTKWDGLPFIPSRDDLKYSPDYSSKDYRKHNPSPVRFLVWDDVSENFWIATKHGLASINRDDIF